MRLIDETAYQDNLAKIPMGERSFTKAVEIAQHMPTVDAAEVVRCRSRRCRRRPLPCVLKGAEGSISMTIEQQYRLRAKLDSIDEITKLLKKAESQTYLSGFDFAILMQEFLVSPTGYVMDVGNWENVNREIALMLFQRIKKHPHLWKWFFMVA